MVTRKYLKQLGFKEFTRKEMHLKVGTDKDIVLLIRKTRLFCVYRYTLYLRGHVPEQWFFRKLWQKSPSIKIDTMKAWQVKVLIEKAKIATVEEWKTMMN